MVKDFVCVPAGNSRQNIRRGGDDLLILRALSKNLVGNSRGRGECSGASRNAAVILANELHLFKNLPTCKPETFRKHVSGALIEVRILDATI